MPPELGRLVARHVHLKEPATANPTFTALHQQMNDISYTACYCSFFDECYVGADDDK